MTADLRKLLLNFRGDVEFALNVSKLAKVIKINNDSSVDIDIQEYTTNKNTSIIVERVPVLFASVVNKLQVNDYVLVVIVDFEFKRSFISSGQRYAKDPLLMHEINNAVIIAKIPNNAFPLLNDEGQVFQHDRAFLVDKETFIVIKDNKVKIKNIQTDIKSLLDNILNTYNTAVKNAIGSLQIQSSTGPCTITNISVIQTTLDNAVNNAKTEINKLFYT